MDLSLLLPERSIEDIFAERVRLVIGGEVYDLPALVIEQNEAWLATVDGQLARLLTVVEEVGENTGAVLQALQEDTAPMFALIESYDIGHVLPGRDVLRSAVTPIGLIRIVMQIWRAANPKADIVLAAFAMTVASSSKSRRPTSLRRRSTAGTAAASGPN